MARHPGPRAPIDLTSAFPPEAQRTTASVVLANPFGGQPLTIIIELDHHGLRLKSGQGRCDISWTDLAP